MHFIKWRPIHSWQSKRRFPIIFFLFRNSLIVLNVFNYLLVEYLDYVTMENYKELIFSCDSNFGAFASRTNFSNYRLWSNCRIHFRAGQEREKVNLIVDRSTRVHAAFDRVKRSQTFLPKLYVRTYANLCVMRWVCFIKAIKAIVTESKVQCDHILGEGDAGK